MAALRRLSGDIRVSVIPRMFELHSWRSEMEELYGLPMAHLPPASTGLRSRVEKRVLDLAVAVPTVVVLLPLWVFVALAIKLDSPGPVFFRQDRTGEGGRSFRVLKFRTMTADAAQQRGTLVAHQLSDGPLFKMAADPRVTRVGALLRRTSLDELPQLFNVLRGEMSLVGPRPLPVEEAEQLDGAALDRLHVAPGITGLWQVSGRSDLTYADLQHLDSVYVRSWSLMWDLRIILATPAAVLGRRGAY
jgi:exopolysaccharide biosynthesis polyprenyl glycosylphosphotransferase